jgi:hypothetical protein
MRTVALIAAVGLSSFGCDRKPAQDKPPTATAPEAQPGVTPDASPRSEASRATLVDLSTSLAAARTEFNAHKGEARFLTLLSPT